MERLQVQSGYIISDIEKAKLPPDGKSHFL